MEHIRTVHLCMTLWKLFRNDDLLQFSLESFPEGLNGNQHNSQQSLHSIYQRVVLCFFMLSELSSGHYHLYLVRFCVDILGLATEKHDGLCHLHVLSTLSRPFLVHCCLFGPTSFGDMTARFRLDQEAFRAEWLSSVWVTENDEIFTTLKLVISLQLIVTWFQVPLVRAELNELEEATVHLVLDFCCLPFICFIFLFCFF